MLKSMTGFGRSEIANEQQKITVEMKAVNHRYCDINVKMPKKLSIFEAGHSNLLKNISSAGRWMYLSLMRTIRRIIWSLNIMKNWRRNMSVSCSR